MGKGSPSGLCEVVPAMSKPKWLEPLEQFAHFWMGFGARLTFLDYLLWRREAVTQWPPGKPFRVVTADTVWGGWVTQLDRVQDMVTDMRWYSIGGTAADLLRAGLVLWWVI